MEGEVKTESTEMIEGPNGLGGVETVSVSVNGISSATAASTASNSDTDLSAALRAEGGVTQGELLRQEQKAGVVPATQLRHGVADSDGMGEDDEMPHARGPEEIGMEDMGPQSSSTGSERKGPGQGMQGIDIEAAIGRKLDLDEADTETEDKSEEEEKATPGTPKREAEQEIGGEEKRVKAEDADIDTDVEVVDADGKTEDEPKTGQEGETKGVDAMDSSAV